MPTTTTPSTPSPVDPKAQPMPAPPAAHIPTVPARIAPASTGWKGGRVAACIRGENTKSSAAFVTGRLAERVVLGPAPLVRVRDLHDLEHVDDVEGERDRGETDCGGGDRRPRVPDAVRAERDEARRERGRRERETPAPDRQRGTRLREPAAQETVVEVC